jgi:hypothetical protein
MCKVLSARQAHCGPTGSGTELSQMRHVAVRAMYPWKRLVLAEKRPTALGDWQGEADVRTGSKHNIGR